MSSKMTPQPTDRRRPDRNAQRTSRRVSQPHDEPASNPSYRVGPSSRRRDREPSAESRLDGEHRGERHTHKAPATKKPGPQARRASTRGTRGEFSFVKALTLSGFVVATLLVLVFGLDLLLAWPFQRASWSFDLINVACGAALAYLSWNTWRDFR